MLPDDAICRQCRYSLKLLSSNICPECGSAFNPDDPSTFKTPLSSKPSQQASPPEAWTILLLVVVLLLWFEELSRPMQGGIYSSCLLLSLVPFFLRAVYDYILRLIMVRKLGRKNESVPKPTPSRRAWRWLALPCFIAIMFSSCISDWPLKLRFEISKSQFEDALKLTQRGQPVNTPAWFGLYRVDSIESDRGTIRFKLGMGPQLWDACGFEYRPSDTPTASRIERRAAPKWYTCEW